jgi:hypothetical protein
MAKPRTDLQAKLLTLAPKAWFKRPPENKMSYPCFIYRPSTPATERADNTLYMYLKGYNVIYISQDPDESIEQQMLETFEHCRADREYEADGLYHYSFTLYW